MDQVYTLIYRFLSGGNIVELHEQLITWRRDFHKHPEQGFLEMRTASIVANELESLGFSLQTGKEVMDENSMMGVPNKETLESHYEWARKNGAIQKYLPLFKDGYTGIVANLKTEKEGPTFAFRVDMDALPILEANDDHHLPKKYNFRSINEGSMHACGHDAHTSIGLGLARMIAANKEHLKGTIKLIFQPAEEGTRGAKSMVEKGIVDDVDYFVATHIGTGVPHKHFVGANNGFLATTKINAVFHGLSSHAGGYPERGKNALLAAASATLNIHAISRHSAGASRAHVGELHSGSGRNVISNHAELLIETRGETSEINNYMKENVINILNGAAKMYDLECTIDIVGEAINCTCSEALAETMTQVASEHSFIENAQVFSKDGSAGSEDATYFLQAVQKRGGQATYCIIGTDLAAGHHNERFDINEASLKPAVDILYETLLIYNQV